jgi:DNA repair photolyase
VIPEKVRTIITTNKSPDIPFDRSINPYRGCEHGCIYCYARPSHAYWDLSPGLDFETRIITKPGAAGLLRETLEKPGYECRSINIGANTDPYQPLEARLGTTREVLEVLQAFNHPFSLITKSAMVLRDLDILAEMGNRNLCSVAISVTTLDNELKRRLEPRTALLAATRTCS